MQRAKVAMPVVMATLAAAVLTPAGASAATGFDTSAAPELVPLRPQVKIDPILTTGDVVGSYQMSGIPDGLGAYPDGGRVQLFMNHELEGTPADARVSHLTLTDDRTVVSGSYPVTGIEGYERFCSASLSLIDGTPTFLTGEESSGGRSIALDGTTGTYTETNHFGFFEHENVIALKGLGFGMFISTEDGTADQSQLYAYSADTPAEALAGQGHLLVWKADGSAGSTADISKGETLAGHFVPLSPADNADPDTLEAAAQRENAFDFTRLEDIAQSKTNPDVVYFNDTGNATSPTKHGRVYQMTIDPSSGQAPAASLRLLLDGDAGDDIVNPDNLDTSRKSLVIQEDRNSENRNAAVAGGYGRVLVYDLKHGDLTPVARVATPPTTQPGEWESSGVLNAARYYGPHWWLLDVQAHTLVVPQPGPSLVPDSGTGEGGQLLAIRIPSSTP